MLVFEIPGNPVPQKQTRFSRLTGKAYNPSKEDEDLLKWQIKQNVPKPPLQGAIELHLYFGLQIPASSSKKQRALMEKGLVPHIKKPDFDNLAYIVTNAMKGIVYNDDAQIVRCLIAKEYDPIPRTIIKVFKYGEINAH